MKWFRDKIKEHRGEYYLTYQPADCRQSFAALNLVYLSAVPGCTSVATTMERELNVWLRKFPVPTLVSSFDLKENLIDVSACRETSHLMGYISSSGEMVKQWRIFADTELPRELISADRLAEIYKSIPSRNADEVRNQARAKAKTLKRAATLISVFVIGIPLAVEILSFGITWIGYVIAGVSVLIGLYKAAKAFGWIKPSERQKRAAEKRQKMEHYFYHCERNLEGFMRRKIENFERETMGENIAESHAIQDQH